MTPFGQGMFQIDPNATPEQIKRHREKIAAMMPQYGKARYIGEGIGQLAYGIGSGIKGRKLDKAEAAGNASASDLFSRIIGGARGDTGGFGIAGASTPPFLPSGSPQAQAPASPFGQGQAVADDTMTALGRTPNSNAGAVRSGLIERGLPEHVADGFVMNFQDESGLQTDINETAPTVPGSRGGFGLAQWTGPRRRQLEAFAAERGVPVSDLNAQLDFLMMELQGSESSAAQSILSAQNAGDAGAAIVNDFLRPAEEHRARRVASYTGGQGTTVSTQGPGTGAQPQPGMGGGQDMAQLYEALANPWLNDQQRSVVAMLIQQQQTANDPMTGLALQKAQLEVEKLRTPEKKDPISIGGVLLDPDTMEPLYDSRTPDVPKDPASVQEYNFYTQQEQAAGRAPLSYNDWDLQGKKAGATSINTGGEVGTIPQGYELFTDPKTGARSLRPIPGGPEDKTRQGDIAAENKGTATDVVLNAADAARRAASARTATGIFGKIASNNPASANAEIYRQVEVLKSNASAENITAMRAASPTGAALGGASDKDMEILASKSGALDPASPTFLRDLDDYERTLLRLVHGKAMGDQIFGQTRPAPPPQQAPNQPAPITTPSGKVIRFDAQGNPIP